MLQRVSTLPSTIARNIASGPLDVANSEKCATTNQSNVPQDFNQDKIFISTFSSEIRFSRTYFAQCVVLVVRHFSSPGNRLTIGFRYPVS